MIHPNYSSASIVISKSDMRWIQSFAIVSGIISFSFLSYINYTGTGIAILIVLTSVSFMFRNRQHLTFMDGCHLCWISKWTNPIGAPIAIHVNDIKHVVWKTNTCKIDDSVSHQIIIETNSGERLELPCEIMLSAKKLCRVYLPGIPVIDEMNHQ